MKKYVINMIFKLLTFYIPLGNELFKEAEFEELYF